MMKKKTIFNGTPLLWILLVAILPLLGACEKGEKIEGEIMEAEGYVIGFHPCVADATVTTSRGEGKGYLVATTGIEPDTLMVYGVPVDMFDIPGEWIRRSLGYLLPEEGRNQFKMRFSYRLSSKNRNIGPKYPCYAINYMLPPPNYPVHLMTPEYIIIKAEKVE